MRIARPYVVVWLLLVLAWTASFVIRVGFPALLPPIMRELDLSYTRAGVLAASFFYAYMAVQLPAGLLGDHFGRRQVLLVGLVGLAAATVLTGLAGSFLALVASRLLTGAFQGFLFSNDRAIIVAVTPPDKIGLGQGVSFSGPGLGLFLGLLLGGVLGEHMSWRRVMMLFALGPLLAAALIAWRVPAPPRSAATEGIGPRLRAVLGNRALWVLGLAGAAGIYVQFVLATWATLFFVEAGVGSLGRAGAYASLQGAAAVAGLVTGGWAGDVLRRRGLGPRAVIVTSLAALAGCMVAMGMTIAHRRPAALAVTLFLAAYFVWSIWGPALALIPEMIAGRHLGTAFGFYNMTCFLGAVVGPTVTGWIRDLAGSFAAACHVAAVVSLLGVALILVLRARPAAVIGT